MLQLLNSCAHIPFNPRLKYSFSHQLLFFKYSHRGTYTYAYTYSHLPLNLSNVCTKAFLKSSRIPYYVLLENFPTYSLTYVSTCSKSFVAQYNVIGSYNPFFLFPSFFVFDTSKYSNKKNRSLLVKILAILALINIAQNKTKNNDLVVVEQNFIITLHDISLHPLIPPVHLLRPSTSNHLRSTSVPTYSSLSLG